MLNETLNKIEAICRSAEQLTDEQKKELSTLVTDLRGELQDLAKTSQADADSIAGFASVATHEHLREAGQKDLQEHATGGLEASISQFRASHPQLMKVIRQFVNTLSNIGV